MAVRVQPLAPPTAPGTRRPLVRQARLLAWGGIAYHVAEFALALGAGLAVGSIALIGIALAGFALVVFALLLVATLGLS